MWAPSTMTANVRHERMGSPSSRTVQAPHTPCSQPTWVPVSRRSWRSMSDSSRRAGTCADRVTPFTVTTTSWTSLGLGARVIGRPPRGNKDRVRALEAMRTGPRTLLPRLWVAGPYCLGSVGPPRSCRYLRRSVLRALGGADPRQRPVDGAHGEGG